MNFYAFSAAISLGMWLLYLKVEWLGFICLFLGLLILLYDPAKKQSTKAWEDMKKAEGNFPDAKLDAYTKGLSKQTAEHLIKSPSTEGNYKGFLHKTPAQAKSFFSELKEILGMK